ncbi:MAG: CGNR zinc finger domain-containing protein [Egibacteraceae bacterium]
MEHRRVGALVAAALVNTGPEVWGEDRLASPGDLATLLAEHGIVGGPVDAAALRQARNLRARLRPVFTGQDVAAAVATLNEIVAEAGACPRLVADQDSWHWELTRDDAGVAQRLAGTAGLGLLSLIGSDGLGRLGRCAAHGCAGVFADTTRNRSRRYCNPEICGNRTNLAAYRARRRG